MRIHQKKLVLFLSASLALAFRVHAEPSGAFNDAEIQKKGGKTTVDFDEASISGVNKTPMGTIMEQTRLDGGDKGLVSIRRHWRPEILKSAKSLNSNGKSVKADRP